MALAAAFGMAFACTGTAQDGGPACCAAATFGLNGVKDMPAGGSWQAEGGGSAASSRSRNSCGKILNYHLLLSRMIHETR